MENNNLSNGSNKKFTFSASSLAEKTESITFTLNECKKKNGNEFFLREINKIVPEINCLCVNKSTNTIGVTFSKHKRRRDNTNYAGNIFPSAGIVSNQQNDSLLLNSINIQEIIDLDEGYLDINELAQPSPSKTNDFIEKTNLLKIIFYDKDPFYYFANLEDYQCLINTVFYNTALDTSPFKQPIKELLETIFEKEIDRNLFTLNKLDEFSSDNLRFFNNSLIIHLFKHLEHIYNTRKNINKIFLFGDKGIGKTYALLIYSLFLRLNPYNLVFSIFNFEEFFVKPFSYFSNEVLHSLHSLYLNNNKLDIKELEAFHSFYNAKNSDQFYESNYKEAFLKFKEMIEKVIKAYDGKINVFFILDNYQRAFQKSPFIDLLENFKLTNSKVIICSNLENNDLVINKIQEVKGLNDLESLDSRLIFLNSSNIFKDEDFCLFVEKTFDYTNRSVIKTVVKLSGANYSYIINFFESVSHHQYAQFSVLKENQIRAYFIDLKKNEFKSLLDSAELSLDKKAYTLYSICSYRTNYEKRSALEYSHSKYDFYSKELFKNYIYKWITPELVSNNIVFKLPNELVSNFLLSFCYEDYLKDLKLKNMSMKYYAEWYVATNDHILKGIFIEELAFLFFKYSNYLVNKERRSFYHRIENFGYFSKGDIVKPDEEFYSNYYSKINNVNNLFIQNNQITSKIEKIKKFYSADDHIFGGDKILKFPNGIYFLNHKFPVVDAIIVNQERKNLILVQIKKTIYPEHLVTYFDDFHILFFLLENQEIYRKLFELQMKLNSAITTKLQLFMKLAHCIKQGWSINLMFTYKYIDNSFGFIEDNGILDNSYFTFENIMEAAKITIEDENFRRNETILGKYQIENNIITLYRRRLLHNILMVDLNDFTAGLIEGKKYSNFIK